MKRMKQYFQMPRIKHGNRREADQVCIGEQVMVYSDPLTQKDQEGWAEVTEIIGWYDVQSQTTLRLMVRFEGEDYDCFRLVKVR
jgi:hypothetical protein